MPFVEHNHVRPPAYQWNGHLQTIWPSVARRVAGVHYVRERLATPDNDFLLLDWSRPNNSRRLGIVAHGLEGDTGRHYVRGLVRALNAAGWDALAWNYRGCGGELNHLRSSYHIGSSDDLDVVVRHVVDRYDELALLGFSAGGNISLKYAGEQGNQLAPAISRVVTFSVPLDLDGVANHFMRLSNKIYDQRFLRTLIAKIRQKAQTHDIDLSHIPKIRTMRHYDEYYGGPLHGFRDAADYYAQAASRFYLDRITVPTLILNARNDPFLPDTCYCPHYVAHLPHVWLEVPQQGGHCGFSHRTLHHSWAEHRAVDFLNHGY